MNQFSLNSIIGSIGDFFSELPPLVLAFIISAFTLSLYAIAGLVTAAIIGFVALGFTHNGPFVISVCGLIFIVFSIFGLMKAYRTYKKIMLNHEIPQS